MKSKRKRRRSRAKGIAEAYIHIKDAPHSLTKEEARRYLQRNIKKWAEKSFKNDVRIEITVEDGSLIVRVLVGALILADLVVIYGGFRSGIDYIVNDSWSFSNTVIESFKQDEHVSDQAIIRAERRLGVPGKIRRFYKSIDKINSADHSHNERQELIGDLKEEFISIIELLEAEQDRELFIAAIPDNLVSQLPQSLPAPIRGSITLEDDTNEIFVTHATDIQMPAPNRTGITHIVIRSDDEQYT